MGVAVAFWLQIGLAQDDRWDRQFMVPGLESTPHALAIDGAHVYIGRDGLYRWNGSFIEQVGGEIDGLALSLLRTRDGLFVGGRFTQVGNVNASNIAKWTGSKWETLGEGVNDSVHAMASDGDAIYVSGNFTTAGNVQARFIAKWQYGRWHALGEGIRNGLDSPAEDMVVDSEGRLFVTGNFKIAGGGSASGAAVWDGREWSALGSGLSRWFGAGFLPGQGNSIAAWNGDIYVGGRFTHAGGSPVHYLAKWNGTSWSALPGIAENATSTAAVLAIASVMDGIYVAGRFSLEGMNRSREFAQWNGEQWHSLIPEGGVEPFVSDLAVNESGDVYFRGPHERAGHALVGYGIGLYQEDEFRGLGNGLQYEINAMERAGDRVYVGGRFSTGSGVFLNNIGVWTGREWLALGEGFDGIVYAIAVHPNGDVYAGGEFTQADGQPANRIARWNGQQWLSVGGGVEGVRPEVSALYFDGTDLYAGGSFSRAGDTAASNVARWDGEVWHALENQTANGVVGRVESIMKFQDDIYLGGGVNTAGGQAAKGLAKWNPAREEWIGIDVFSPELSTSDVHVSAMIVQGDQLVMGGAFFFESAQGRTLHLAKWDGSNLSPIDTAQDVYIRGRVGALYQEDDKLYVGGTIGSPDGEAHNDVAVFDGNGWSTLNGRFNGEIHALTILKDQLVIGGSFGKVGDIASSGIAQWRLGERRVAVTLTEPEPNASFQAGEPIALRAEVDAGIGDISRVEFYQGLAYLGMDSDAPYEWNWELARAGDYELTARAFTVEGVALHSDPVSVSVTPSPGNIPPFVQLIEPSNGDVVVEGLPLDIVAKAVDLDGLVTALEFYLDDVLVPTATQRPFTHELLGIQRGQRRVYVRAIDNSGEATTSAVATLTVEAPNQRPIVGFIEPRPGVYELPNPIAFVARASDYDGRLSSVEFFADDRLLARFPEQPGEDIYRFEWRDAEPGVYTARVVATDEQGAATERTSQPIEVVPPNARPLIAIVSPQDGERFSEPTRLTARIEASDPDGSVESVKFFVGDTQIGTKEARPYEFQLPRWTDGTYRLYAEAEDDRGAVVRSPEITIHIATTFLRFHLVDLSAHFGTGASVANDINSQGAIAGMAHRPNSDERGYVHENHPIFGVATQYYPAQQNLPANFRASGSWAQGLNDLGQAVGFGVNDVNQMRAALFLKDRTIDLGLLTDGGGESRAMAINNQNQIVGVSASPLTSSQAFLFENGMMTDLCSLGHRFSEALAINNQGQIVGYSYESDMSYKAFLYEIDDPNPRMINLGAMGPEFPFSRGEAINDTGQIVGELSNNQGTSRGFIIEAGVLKMLESLGGIRSGALGINNLGVAVGHSRNYEKEPHACLWFDGLAYDLNELVPENSGWRLQEARAINDCGQIVGFGNYTASDQRRAFLLSPALDVQAAPALELNRQTGLFEHKARIANPAPFPLCVLRLMIQGLPEDVVVMNGKRHESVDYVEYGHRIGAFEELELTIEYFVPDRRTIPIPDYQADVSRPVDLAASHEREVIIHRTVRLENGNVMVEFDAHLATTYQIQYSFDLATWIPAIPDIQGRGKRMQWIDQGPPKTERPPAQSQTRFYRIVKLTSANPTE